MSPLCAETQSKMKEVKRQNHLLQAYVCNHVTRMAHMDIRGMRLPCNRQVTRLHCARRRGAVQGGEARKRLLPGHAAPLHQAGYEAAVGGAQTRSCTRR